MMELFSFMPLMYLLYLYMPLPLGAYLLQRWRIFREGKAPDSRLGQKVIIHFFLAVALPLFLAGITLLMASLLGSGSDDFLRIGAALTVAGAIVLVMHFVLSRIKFPAGEANQVGRIFLAFNLIVIGLIAVLFLTMTSVFFFQTAKNGIEVPLAGLIVFGLAWIILSVKYFGAETGKSFSIPSGTDSHQDKE